MAVEVQGVEPDFLERVWKLMLICEKIKRTMHSRGRVIIENARCQYVTVYSDGPIRYLLAMTKVTEWSQFQCVWVPSGLLLGNLEQCRVMAGMRSQAIVEQDGFWFEGSDRTGNQFEWARLSRDGLRENLQQKSALGRCV